MSNRESKSNFLGLVKEEFISAVITIQDWDREIEVHPQVPENFASLNYDEVYDNQESCQENQETIFNYNHHSLEDSHVFDSPIYDEYLDPDDNLHEQQVGASFYEVFDQEFNDSGQN